MPDFLVTGKKGNGKSLVCVGRIRDALLQGRPVATNLDIRVEHLLPHRLRNVRLYRLPDKPTRADLDALGHGNPDQQDGIYDEDRNGLIVLDELATWLNARTFGDRDRQPMLDWLVHSRKLGWDTYLIAQGPNQIDKQIREALVDYHVPCKRLDRMRVPFIGLRLPKIHVAFVKYGVTPDAPISEKWWYRGRDLYRAYDTRQRFLSDYPHGLFSYLPPWHLVGWRSIPRWWEFWKPRRRVPLIRKHPLAIKLSKLPFDDRVKHWRRFNDLGAFE